MADSATTTLSRAPTVTAAAMRGATRRWIGLRPMTRMASTSSRTVWEPRPAHTADPTAPAISREVTNGAPWRSTPMPLTAPVKDVAPICWATAPTWTATMTPNGMATRIVGRKATRVMNQACSKNSRQEKRARTMSTTTKIEAWMAMTIISPNVCSPASALPRMASTTGSRVEVDMEVPLPIFLPIGRIGQR